MKKVREVQQGEKFLCVKTVKMKGDKKDIRYIKGRIYTSEKNGAITDEKGNESHWWNNPEKKYFQNLSPDYDVILKGERFVCIKDVVMRTLRKPTMYSKGFIYISEEEGCITNNEGHIYHGWQNVEKFFIKILTEK